MTSCRRIAAPHNFKHPATAYSETTPVLYPEIDPNPAIRGRFPRHTHQSARNNPGLGIRAKSWAVNVQLSREGAMSSDVQLFDATGRRRSPATLPEFHVGRAPGEQGSALPC